MREVFSTGTDFPLCSKCSLCTVHVSETKPLLAWCFPYETLDPIFLLPSAFLLSILNYSYSSCSRLQMSRMFSSEQHKFSRLTRKAKRKKEKTKPQTRIISYFSPAWSKQQALQGWHPSNHCTATGKEQSPWATQPTLQPGMRGTSYPESSRKPGVPRQGKYTDSKPAQHLTGSSWAKERERRGQQLQRDKENVCLHWFCASCDSTGLARPFPEGGRAGTQVRDQKYPDTAHSIR